MTTISSTLEPWAIDELNDRADRRSFGLVNYESKSGEMIPGMYVVYAWRGDSLDDMRLGGGQALFDSYEKANDFCNELDDKEVIENMSESFAGTHLRWTISYIPFVK